jgi:predicted dehydrogenase
MAVSGMNYAPEGKAAPVVRPGEFVFAATALDHGHIYGMCNGLIEAGATLKSVWDPDEKKVADFIRAYPGTKAARSLDEILGDREVALVAGAAVPSLRCALGLRVMAAGKDYFTDKTPLISLGQLEDARKAARETGRKYMCYYSERLHVEAAVYAGYLVEEGAIGRVLQVRGVGPHRLSAPSRPRWFFEKEKYGGILTDIGSHQIEQFLFYSGAKDAEIVSSRIANYGHPEYPELEDYGEAILAGDNGVSNYFQVNWFTPDALQDWGDGRLLITGTEGFIELRKYLQLGSKGAGANHVYLANGKEETYYNATGKTGYPFFGQLILDCLNRTENAMTQRSCFKAVELCIKAQEKASVVKA